MQKQALRIHRKGSAARSPRCRRRRCLRQRAASRSIPCASLSGASAAGTPRIAPQWLLVLLGLAGDLVAQEAQVLAQAVHGVAAGEEHGVREQQRQLDCLHWITPESSTFV